MEEGGASKVGGNVGDSIRSLFLSSIFDINNAGCKEVKQLVSQKVHAW